MSFYRGSKPAKHSCGPSKSPNPVGCVGFHWPKRRLKTRAFTHECLHHLRSVVRCSHIQWLLLECSSVQLYSLILSTSQQTLIALLPQLVALFLSWTQNPNRGEVERACRRTYRQVRVACSIFTESRVCSRTRALKLKTAVCDRADEPTATARAQHNGYP